MPSLPGTSNFPTALDDAISLGEYANNASSTISGALTTTTLLIPVADPAEFPSSGFATLLDSLSNPTAIEIIAYTSKSGSNLVVPSTSERGMLGTTPQTWSSGAYIEQRIVTGYFTALRGGLIAAQTKLGYGSDTAANGEFLAGTGTGTSGWRVIAASDLPTAIDAAKIADGSISNTEFQYLNGLSGAIQTQLDGKLSATPPGSAKQVIYNSGGTAYAAAAGVEYQSGASPNVLIQAQDNAHVGLRILPATNSYTAYPLQVLDATGSYGLRVDPDNNLGSGDSVQILGSGAGDAGFSAMGAAGLSAYFVAYADAGSGTIAAFRSNATGSSNLLLETNTAVIYSDSSVGLTLAAYSATAYLRFGVGGSSNAAERLRITSSDIQFYIAPVAQTAAGVSIGSAALPFQYLYLAGDSGTPGSNNFTFTGTATAARTITFPDATDTVVTLAASQSLTNKKLGSLTSNGFVKTGSGDGTLSVDTATYAPTGSITASSLTMNTSRLLGRTTASSGAVEEITVGSGLSLSGGELSATGGGMSIGGTVTSGTTGSLLFVGAGPVLAQDNANLFWDDSANRLGIGTASPSQQLHIQSAANSTSGIDIRNSSNGASAIPAVTYFADSRTYTVGVGSSGYTSAALRNTFFVHDTTAGTFRFVINSGGQVGIGTGTTALTANVALQVTGLTQITRGNNPSVLVLSGNASQYTMYQLGRTATESDWGIASGAGAFSTFAVAGDAVFRATSGDMIITNTASGKSLRFGSGGASDVEHGRLDSGGDWYFGPNGTTNPTLKVVTSTASGATGLSITNAAAGSGVTLATISSGSNENLILNPKGTGGLVFGPSTRSQIFTNPNTANAGADVMWGATSTTTIPLVLQDKPAATAVTFRAERSDGTLAASIGRNGIDVANSSGNALIRANAVAGFFQLASGVQLTWSDTATAPTTIDTGLARAAAAVVRVSDGSTGAGSLIIGASAGAIGTSGAGVLAMALSTAPSTSPADTAQIWAADMQGTAGNHGFHLRNEINTASLILPGVRYKTDAGDPTDLFEGMIVINTNDNNVKIYADGALRQLVTW